MSQIEAKLAELGLALPTVAAPLAAYVPAVQSGDLVYTSGQLPTVDGKLIVTGHVGDGHGSVPLDAAKQAAAQAVLNALAAIKSVTGDLDRIEQIVKLTGFVACEPSFSNHPAVVNGASELLGAVFGDAGKHARSSVGMTSLPLGAPVEIEVIARVKR